MRYGWLRLLAQAAWIALLVPGSPTAAQTGDRFSVLSGSRDVPVQTDVAPTDPMSSKFNDWYDQPLFSHDHRVLFDPVMALPRDAEAGQSSGGATNLPSISISRFGVPGGNDPRFARAEMHAPSENLSSTRMRTLAQSFRVLSGHDARSIDGTRVEIHVGFENAQNERLDSNPQLETMRLPPLNLGVPFTVNENDEDTTSDRILANEVRPRVLRDPAAPVESLPSPAAVRDDTYPLLRHPFEPPYGFSGPSSVVPSESQTSSHFVPLNDLWRLGFPDWDRYGKGHPCQDDYPGVEGTIWDPYNQNVLKGDFPIRGQHTFLNVTATSFMLHEGRQLPTPTTPFEATQNPGLAEFFGDPDQYLFVHNGSLTFDLFHGNTSFKPVDWRVKAEMIYNANVLVVEELAIVSPDVRDGTSRYRQHLTFEQWFLEAKLMDTSPHYDFTSVRVGSQPFVSDFRGFIFADINRGVRLFGTRHANRDQFNIVWFDQMEKDTNSLLNRPSEDRGQNTWIVNYFRQDFVFPGYNVNFSFHANHDRPDIKFDRNNFLVRPDPVGIFQPHDVRAYYFGAASNGHIERYNVSSALYYVFGRDDLNPLAGQRQDISAFMAALELSYDRDWVRFRSSYFFSSGDSDPNDHRATGFDAIFPNPNFAGTEFSYWGRQGIRLFGVELTNRLSLTPSLRSSKFQGQTNFVNPGLHLINLGMDADITPKLKLIHNTNFLWFHHTEVLETYLFTGDVRNFIGTDMSLGVEYRPLLNNNLLLIGGISGLISGNGFKDLFQNLEGNTPNFIAGFLEAAFVY